MAEIAENSLNVLALPLSITTDRLHLLVFGKKRGFDHPRFLFVLESSAIQILTMGSASFRNNLNY